MTVTMYGWLLFSAIAMVVLVWWLNRRLAQRSLDREYAEVLELERIYRDDWHTFDEMRDPSDGAERAQAAYEDYLDDAEDAAQEAFDPSTTRKKQ